MPELLIGLDGWALLRQSRAMGEPDVVAAAALAHLAGADGVTVGLRSDRKHVQLRDVQLLRSTVQAKLQVRIPPTPESIKTTSPFRLVWPDWV